MKTKETYSLEKVFSFENLYSAAKGCLKSTRWKASSIAFEHNLTEEAETLRQEILNGTYVQRGFCSFKITERGKTRNIDALRIRDRTVQKCLCRYFLIPVLTPVFIKDTYACIKGRGLHAFEKRITDYEHHLFQSTGGNNFYVLQMDMHAYFESIDHEILKALLNKYIDNNGLKRFIFTEIDMFNSRQSCQKEGTGVCLGSEIAQIMGQFYLSGADHFIKEQLSVKYYARYNDDIVIYGKDRNKLCKIMEHIKVYLSEKLNIEVNTKKCKITKCSHNYTVLKTRRRILPSGKILRLPFKGTRRRKRNDFRNILKHKNASYENAAASFNGWKNHILCRHISAYKIIKALEHEISRQ